VAGQKDWWQMVMWSGRCLDRGWQKSGGPGLFRVEGKRRACPVVC
jgi:hypothetical protein